MTDIREQAKQYRKDVELRALAHEASAEWHRGRGVRLGGAATLLSAVVGTSIFVTLTTQLKEGKLDLSDFGLGGWKSWAIFGALGFALVLSPVLAGMQAYLKHPEQAATHKASYVGYCRLKQRIDLFLLRYPDDNSANTDRIRALEQLDAISRDIEKVATNSITLAKAAYASAAQKLSGEKRKPWWQFW
jgi:hypothetical protein